MKNKKLIIGLGVLAVAGIGYYIWKKNKISVVDSSDKSDSNFTGIRKTKNCCVKQVNGVCTESKEVHYLVPCPNIKSGSARTVPMPSTGVCPKGYMKGANDSYCRPIPSGGR